MPFTEQEIEDAVIIEESTVTPELNPDYSIKHFGIQPEANKVELLLNALHNIYKQLDVIIENPDYQHHVGNLRKYIAEVIDIGVLEKEIIPNWSDAIDKQSWLPIDQEIIDKWDEAFSKIVIEAINGMRAMGESVLDIGKVTSAIVDLHVSQTQKLKASYFAGRGEVKTFVDKWHALARTKGASTNKLFVFMGELIAQLEADANKAPVTPVSVH